MKKRQWIVVGALAVGFVVLAWLGWAFLLSGVKKGIRAAEDERTQLEEQLKAAKAKKAQYEKFQAQAENVRRAHLFLTQRLDPQVRVMDFYRQLNALGTRLGLTQFRFESNDTKRVLSKLPGVTGLDEQLFNFNFRGRYNHVGEFINGANSMDRLMVAERVTLSPVIDSRARDTVEAKIEMKLYLETRKEAGK